MATALLLFHFIRATKNHDTFVLQFFAQNLYHRLTMIHCEMLLTRRSSLRMLHLCDMHIERNTVITLHTAFVAHECVVETMMCHVNGVHNGILVVNATEFAIVQLGRVQHGILWLVCVFAVTVRPFGLMMIVMRQPVVW